MLISVIHKLSCRDNRPYLLIIDAQIIYVLRCYISLTELELCMDYDDDACQNIFQRTPGGISLIKHVCLYIYLYCG